MLESPSSKESWRVKYTQLDQQYEQIHTEIRELLSKPTSPENNKKLEELLEEQIKIMREQSNLFKNRK
jgi:hypothetical protein